MCADAVFAVDLLIKYVIDFQIKIKKVITIFFIFQLILFLHDQNKYTYAVVLLHTIFSYQEMYLQQKKRVIRMKYLML